MILEYTDALLRRVLPAGDHGESIIGDLRQELDSRRAAGSGASELWYLRSAASLIVRYGPARVRQLFSPLNTESPKEEPMGNLMADLRFAVRVLLKTPQLSAVAILTIALGVGLTTHTFSVVYGAILRGLPVPNDQELMAVHANNLSRDVVEDYLSYPDYLAVKEQVSAFSSVVGYSQGSINLAGEDAPPERYTGASVTWDLFDLVGVPPFLGRTFTRSDDQPDATLTAVLSYEVWQNRFGGDREVLGATIRVNAQTATIIGVMPDGFRFPFNEQLWVPLRYDAAEPRESASYLGTIARLRDGSTLDAAGAEVGALGARIAAEYPNTNEGRSLSVQKYEDSVMPLEIQATLWAMLAAVFGVLLIACVNVANLLLARATIRSKEMAVRTAMGATRWRVTRQLLAEAGVLALLGSVLGLGLAYFGVEAFNRAILDIQKPYWIDIRVDVPALLFTLSLTAVVALVAGIIPARRAAGVNVNAVLKDESRGTSSLRMGRFSSALVMLELAVSCALLVSAGLMVKSVVNLRSLDLGFETDRVMTGRVALFEGDHPTREDRADFFRRLEAGLAAIPGVAAASLVSDLPGSGADRWPFAVEGEAYATDTDYPRTWGAMATADFFEVMQTEWVRGRPFRLADGDPGAEPVMIVNESFASRYFPDGDAIGKRIRLGRAGSTNPFMRIVGIVGDMHVGGGIGGIGSDQLTPEQVYVPPGVFDFRFLSLAVLTQGPPGSFATPIRELVSSLDANLPVSDVATMDAVIDQNTWAFGLFGSLFTLFGVVALFLAAVGLYGVMAFSVSQRQQEIGVRMALGAKPGDIVRLVLRKGTVQIMVGLGAGLGLGWLLARPLAVMLYGVDPLDPAVYGTIAATLLFAGLLASFVPALTATRADPVRAMRV